MDKNMINYKDENVEYLDSLICSNLTKEKNERLKKMIKHTVNVEFFEKHEIIKSYANIFNTNIDYVLFFKLLESFEYIYKEKITSNEIFDVMIEYFKIEKWPNYSKYINKKLYKTIMNFN